MQAAAPPSGIQARRRSHWVASMGINSQVHRPGCHHAHVFSIVGRLWCRSCLQCCPRLLRTCAGRWCQLHCASPTHSRTRWPAVHAGGSPFGAKSTTSSFKDTVALFHGMLGQRDSMAESITLRHHSTAQGCGVCPRFPTHLVRSADQIQVMPLQEVCDTVWAKCVAHPTVILTPALHRTAQCNAARAVQATQYTV